MLVFFISRRDLKRTRPDASPMLNASAVLKLKMQRT